MRKKKILLSILMALTATFATAATLSACFGGNGVSQNSEQEIVVDIPEIEKVEVGNGYDFSMAAIMVDGEIFTPSKVVVTHNGTTVTTENRAFTATKKGEYTIMYTFNVGGGTKEYKTTVLAVDTVKPSLILSEELPARVEANTELTIPVIEGRDNCDEKVSVTYKVYVNNDERTPVDVIEGKISIQDYEGYVIEAKAKDNSENEETKEFFINVRGKNEIDYFNNESFTMASIYNMHGGKTAFNTQAEYVIEGTGSIKHYTDAAGKYPTIRSNTLTDIIQDMGGIESFVQEVHSISYMVYNASPFTFNSDFTSFDFDEASNSWVPYKMQRYVNVPCNTWTKVSFTSEQIQAIYKDETTQFGWSLNGDDVGAGYANYVAYYDCLRFVMKGEEGNAVELGVKDVTATPNQGGSLQIADFSTTELDLSKLTVSATAASGEGVIVSEKEGKYSLPCVRGIYTVTYLYQDGENITIEHQTVRIKEPLTDPNFDGFEDDTGTRSWGILHGNLDISISEEKAHSGTKSLKIQNGIDSPWPQAILRLDESMLAAMDDNTKLTFWVYIDQKDSTATSFNLRFRNISQTSPYFCLRLVDGYNRYDGLAAGEWYEMSASGEALKAIKAEGGLSMFIEFAGGINPANDGIAFYVDDFKLTKGYMQYGGNYHKVGEDGISILRGTNCSIGSSPDFAVVANGAWEGAMFVKLALPEGFMDNVGSTTKLKMEVALRYDTVNGTTVSGTTYKFDLRSFNSEDGDKAGVQLVTIDNMKLFNDATDDGSDVNRTAEGFYEVIVDTAALANVTENALWLWVAPTNPLGTTVGFEILIRTIELI